MAAVILPNDIPPVAAVLFSPSSCRFAWEIPRLSSATSRSIRSRSWSLTATFPPVRQTEQGGHLVELGILGFRIEGHFLPFLLMEGRRRPELSVGIRRMLAMKGLQ